MAAAYRYADGGQDVPPRDLVLLRYIERFGVEAIMGRRALGAGEIRRMTIVEHIIRLYEQRAQSANWAAWESENPDAALLNRAMVLAEMADD